MDIDNPGPINDYYAVLHSVTPYVLQTSFEVSDAAFDGDAFYYVRLTQADDKRAWSSPIWVDRGSRLYLPAVIKGG